MVPVNIEYNLRQSEASGAADLFFYLFFYKNKHKALLKKPLTGEKQGFRIQVYNFKRRGRMVPEQRKR